MGTKQVALVIHGIHETLSKKKKMLPFFYLFASSFSKYLVSSTYPLPDRSQMKKIVLGMRSDSVVEHSPSICVQKWV